MATAARGRCLPPADGRFVPARQVRRARWPGNMASRRGGGDTQPSLARTGLAPSWQETHYFIRRSKLSASRTLAGVTSPYLLPPLRAPGACGAIPKHLAARRWNGRGSARGGQACGERLCLKHCGAAACIAEKTPPQRSTRGASARQTPAHAARKKTPPGAQASMAPPMLRWRAAAPLALHLRATSREYLCIIQRWELC